MNKNDVLDMHTIRGQNMTVRGKICMICIKNGIIYQSNDEIMLHIPKDIVFLELSLNQYND